MASIQLLIQSENNPAVIYLRIRDGRSLDIKSKTNFHINPLDWDKTEQRPLKRLLKDPYFSNLNTDLAELKVNVLRHFNNSKGSITIDKKWLDDFINPTISPDKPTEYIVNYIDIYVEQKSRDLKPSTIKKCFVIKGMYQKFEKQQRTKYTFRDIDTNFKTDYENFCVRQGFAPNTITRSLRFLKTLSNHAKINGVEINPLIDTFKIRYKKSSHIYLSDAEIEKIENINPYFLTDSLKNAKDWLLISCYCGQRVSDFLRFDKSMIRTEKNKNGKDVTLIEFTQVKTDKIMTIPLHHKILEILKKYEGNFPAKISDQKYNDYIKNVCKIAGINSLEKGIKFNPETKLKEEGTFEKWELVSSHIGRRSFATNNYGKVPTSILKYITGHSTEALFLTYIGKSNKDMAMEITDYF